MLHLVLENVLDTGRFLKSINEITMNKLLLASIILGVIGCASTPIGQIIEAAGPAPTIAQAEQVVLSSLLKSLRDPESLKQFSMIGEPQFVNGITAGNNIEQGWLACFEYNAKNGYGGYSGLKKDGYVLRLSGNQYIVISQINWISMDRICH